MKIGEAFGELVKDAQKAIGREATTFYSELVASSPVDTGTFKSHWKVEKQTEYEWHITNNMVYASVLWDGRRQVGNKMQGSEQWAEGGDPMLLRSNKRLNEKLDSLKR